MKDRAFTGIEAAVVLVAFVVVATVFTFAYLQMGFFSAEKTSDVAYEAVKEISTISIRDGAIYGEWNTENKRITGLTFYIFVLGGSPPLDLHQFVILNNGKEIPHTSIYYGDDEKNLAAQTDPVLLVADTKTKIIIKNLVNGPQAGENLVLEAKPPVGASSLIKKKLYSGYEGGVI